MIDSEKLTTLLAHGVSIELEFKSERQRKIADKEIYEEVVAMANTSGGILLVGVEDDGTVTGAQPRHGQATDRFRFQSAIFNNTVPSINTRISILQHTTDIVVAIEVDPYPEPCATASGKSLRRAIGGDGKPQTVPFYPRDQRSRRVDLGLLDFSAQKMESKGFDALSPLEFERLRGMIARLRGDRSLLELSDSDLAKALMLVETEANRLTPNISGLLLVGKEPIIEELFPTHEINFQVFDSDSNVVVNECFHGPLLKVLEELESRFAARNEEREMNLGLFRVPIPDYSPIGFREALNNAVVHRDYSRLGGIYIQWYGDRMLITNPGGLPEGITVENILVHEPKPRNPRLTEAFKRIGLVEKTGRGVDKIYEGQIRYGRPVPDYSRTDSQAVRVILHGGKPSLEFAAFVYEQDKNETPLSLDELMALNELFFERRTDSERLGGLIQKGTVEGRKVLERLHERGFVEAKGEKKGRVYHLAGHLYSRFGMEKQYVRAKGFQPFQQEQMIFEYVRTKGRITRSEVAGLCHLTSDQAARLLRRLVKKHPGFRLVGEKRGSFYTLEEGRN